MQPFDSQNKAIQINISMYGNMAIYNILIDLSLQSVRKLNLHIHGINLELNATFPSKECNLHL